MSVLLVMASESLALGAAGGPTGAGAGAKADVPSPCPETYCQSEPLVRPDLANSSKRGC